MGFAVGFDRVQVTAEGVQLEEFATVRHRTIRTKGSLWPKTARLMVSKLVAAAAKTWRRLKGENQLPKVVRGVKFHNGVEVIETLADSAA